MKTFLKLLMFSCVLIAVTSAGRAEKWDFLGEHPQGKMYLDADRLEWQGDQVVFWMKRVFPQPQQAVDGSFQYTEQQVRHEVDCVQKTVTFTAIRFFDGDGKQVAVMEPIQEGPNPIDPSGFIQKGADQVCLQKAFAPIR